MRVISNKALINFSTHHPAATKPLQAWRKRLESHPISNFAELKSLFNSVDKVSELAVFNIGGNKFRLIALIDFDKQMAFVRHIFTHAGYDHWRPRR
jgi:mRNA interferase HigB